MVLHRVRFLFGLACATGAAMSQAPDGASPPAAPAPAIARDVRAIAGWQVLVDARLLASERPATERALELLGQMLVEVVRVVPPSAVAALRTVPLFVSPAYPGQRSGAEYHPGAAWLRDHGRDPAMARGVEFSGVADFEQEMQRMPNFALHELAHAYHDRVLSRGFANPAILRAFEQAKTDGRYARVERWHGPSRPTTFESAYALTSAMEYFAEGTEAYFVRNDFAPFTRAELRAHDPTLCALLAQLWGVDAVAAAAAAASTPTPTQEPSPAPTPPFAPTPTPTSTTQPTTTTEPTTALASPTPPPTLPAGAPASPSPAADRGGAVAGPFAILALGSAVVVALVLAARRRRRARVR